MLNVVYINVYGIHIGVRAERLFLSKSKFNIKYKMLR